MESTKKTTDFNISPLCMTSTSFHDSRCLKAAHFRGLTLTELTEFIWVPYGGTMSRRMLCLEGGIGSMGGFFHSDKYVTNILTLSSTILPCNPGCSPSSFAKILHVCIRNSIFRSRLGVPNLNPCFRWFLSGPYPPDIWLNHHKISIHFQISSSSIRRYSKFFLVKILFL